MKPREGAMRITGLPHILFACGARAARGLLLALTVALLGACAGAPHAGRDLSQLAPLSTPQGTLDTARAAVLAPTPDLLAVDDEMRAFVDRYTSGVTGDRQRLTMLHRALVGAGGHDLQYDPFADGTAGEAFHRGSANCLSFASLLVALAREAGLDARYQWVEVRPQWSMLGERVAVRLHVNTRVSLRHGEQYMADLDPVPTQDIAGTRPLSDRDARALYHNNLAMDALSREELEMAWSHAVQALRLSPRMPHLWVNLGAVYRLAGQYREAEASYRYALELDPGDRSAMNNLAVLFGLEGREDERQLWLARIERYRQTNPYYHAWLGDQAGRLGDWREALRHYERAVRLLPEDSQLLYAKGLIHYELDEVREAADLIRRAIDKAALSSDREAYQHRLDLMKREALVGLQG
jgi:Flp pilus assembly protein TadD